MAIVGEPVLVDGSCVCSYDRRRSYCKWIQQSEKLLWNFNNDGNLGAVWGKPVVTDQVVYIADVDGNVYAVNTVNGKSLWPSPFSAGGSIIGGGVDLQEEVVVFGRMRGKSSPSIVKKEPKTIATFENPIYSSFKVDGENIIFTPASKNLHCFRH